LNGIVCDFNQFNYCVKTGGKCGCTDSHIIIP
jgi:hypothetical protein